MLRGEREEVVREGRGQAVRTSNRVPPTTVATCLGEAPVDNNRLPEGVVLECQLRGDIFQ